MTAQNIQTFRGVLLDQMTIDALLLAEQLAGLGQFPIMQGSFTQGAVSASAGTHDGGGAIDVGIHSGDDPWDVQVTKVRSLRQAGFAAWRRTPPAFPYHIHAILIADPWVSPGAAEQIDQWHQHLNGLAGHGPDDDPVDVEAGRPSVVTTPPPAPRPNRRKLDEEVV
ncbi:hypothetical protein ABT095_20105 [Kitasatospora sp. NPDC002227]|uniref:hypothetical protein n=1 Tax=Kitasatospora sp. NPDC002227 TaxID=3154773 RepID=UPI00332EA088